MVWCQDFTSQFIVVCYSIVTMLLQVSGTLDMFQSMTLASRKEFYRNKGKTGFRHPDQMTHENTARHRCSPVTGVRVKM